MIAKAILLCVVGITFNIDPAFTQTKITQEDFSKHLTKEYTSIDGKKVFVFDGIIPEHHILKLTKAGFLDDKWRFVLPDQFLTKEGKTYDSKNGIPWKSWQDPTLFSSTKIGYLMKDLVGAVDANLHNGTGLEFDLNELYMALIRRGDRTTLHTENKSSSREYTMAIYHNVVWRKNSYGETMFFDDDEEIFAVVRPKFGRVVLWESSVGYLFRPPSINQLSCQYVHIISLSANSTKNAEKREYFRKVLGKSLMPADQEFVCKENASSVNIDVAKHRVLYRKNVNGYPVGVYDGLFSESDLFMLRQWTIDNGLFFFSDLFDLESDNVHFIAGILAKNLLKSRFWPVILKLAEHMSGKDTWYPYDVACNLIRSADHTRIHLDTSGAGQEEMTFLLYLSPNWTVENYGETAFMEYSEDTMKNEYVAEVVPLFGRAVIFDGDFPHSARPPSVLHYGPRYTLAVKLAPTKVQALKKILNEESRHEMSWIDTSSTLEMINLYPEAMVASHKVNKVTKYLETREIQIHLDKSMTRGEDENEGDEENNEEGGEENNEGEGEENNKEGGEENEGEGEENNEGGQEENGPMKDPEGDEWDELFPLPTRSKKMIRLMKKEHNYDELMDSTEAYVYPEEKMKHRQQIIAKWIESTEGDPDALEDYAELYLKQQARVKEHHTKRTMIALL